MFDKLKTSSDSLKTNFNTKIDKEINNIPDSFANKEQKDFLEELKKGTSQLLKSIDNKYPLTTKENIEINYKMKINILTDLNNFIKKYPTIKATKKLNVFLLLKKVTEDLNSLKSDILTSNKAILPDEYLKDADFPGFNNISDKIEDADAIQNTNDLIALTESVKLSGKIKGKEAWNKFFDDIRDKVPSNQRDEFEQYIKNFKKDFSYLYESKINTSDVGKSLDTTLESIKKGDLDKEFERGYKINVDSKLFGALGSFEIGPFTDKNEAIRAIYKVKLVFKEVEENSNNIIVWLFNQALIPAETGIESAGGELADIYENGKENLGYGAISTLWNTPAAVIQASLGIIISGLLVLGVPATIVGIPIVKARGRIQDFLSKHFGDKGWAQPIKSFSEGINKVNKKTGEISKSGWSTMGKKGLINRLWGLTKFSTGSTLWIGSKPFDLFFGTAGNLLDSAEKRNLDFTYLDTKHNNIRFIDGLNSSIGDGTFDNANNNEMMEIRSRARLIAMEIKIAEYEGNTKKVKLFEKLLSSDSITSNGENFYKDFFEYKYGDLETTSFRNRYIGNKGEKIPKTIKDIYLNWNKKEGIVLDYKNTIKNMNGLLGIIYKGTVNNFEEGKITIPESKETTDFYKRMKANIDLSYIDDLEEVKRQDLLKKLEEQIKEGRLGKTTPKELEFEITKIVEGKVPKFKALEEIKKKQKQLEISGTDLEKENLENFRKKILDGNWYGTFDELEDGLRDLDTKEIDDNKPILRTEKELDKEGKKLLKYDFKKSPDFAEKTSIDYYNNSMKNSGLELRLGLIQNTDESTIRSNLTRYLNLIKNNSKDIDLTSQEHNFNVKNILEGKPYDSVKTGYGDKTVDINKIIHDFDDFDDLERNRVLRIIKEIDKLPFNEKLDYIKTIESDNSLYEKYIHLPEYKIIRINISNDLDKKINLGENEINNLNIRHSNSIKNVHFEEGKNKNIESSFQKISQNIIKLENEYNNILGSRSKITDKIDFINDFYTKINGIKSKITLLESQVKTTNNTGDSINKQNQNNPKKSPTEKPKEKISPEEKIKKIENLYKRAILQAELDGDSDKVDSLLNRSNSFDIENTTIKKEQTNIKKIFGINRISLIGDYDNLLKRKIGVLEELEKSGLIEKLKIDKNNITFNFKESTITGVGTLEERLEAKASKLTEPNFIKILIKALKKGE